MTTTHLHFDLGANRDAFESLFHRFVRLGAKPQQKPIACTLSLPIQLKTELENYLRMSLRFLEESDFDPCSVELRHMLAHIGPDNESLMPPAPSASGIWNSSMKTGYVATEPPRPEVHHTASVPKHAGTSAGGSVGLVPHRGSHLLAFPLPARMPNQV